MGGEGKEQTAGEPKPKQNSSRVSCADHNTTRLPLKETSTKFFKLLIKHKFE